MGGTRNGGGCGAGAVPHPHELWGKGCSSSLGMLMGLCSEDPQSTSWWGGPIGFSGALHGQKVAFAISPFGDGPLGWV